MLWRLDVPVIDFEEGASMPRRRPRLMLSSLGCAGLLAWVGCHPFVDEITSREFRLRQLVQQPDPIAVLRSSDDGDARAKAMRRLKEPIRNGGTPELQDEILEILTRSAVEDPRPICRLAAIEALGRFQDERAAPALLQAYHASRQFPTEIANAIRCAAMSNLGGKDYPEGFDLLVQVAMTPREKPEKSEVTPASFSPDAQLAELLGHYDPDHQAARDARLAAIRALGQAKNPRALSVLIPLVDDKDVSVRDRAHEALQNLTGRRDVEKSAAAWQSAFNGSATK